MRDMANQMQHRLLLEPEENVVALRQRGFLPTPSPPTLDSSVINRVRGIVCQVAGSRSRRLAKGFLLSTCKAGHRSSFGLGLVPQLPGRASKLPPSADLSAWRSPSGFLTETISSMTYIHMYVLDIDIDIVCACACTLQHMPLLCQPKPAHGWASGRYRRVMPTTIGSAG